MKQTQWIHPLIGASMDRMGPRTLLGSAGGATGRSCHKLSGVDGSVEGGLRPFPGFRQVYEFNVTKMNRVLREDKTDSASTTGDDTVYHGDGTHIADFESFTFQHFSSSNRIRDAWGIVYRAQRDGNPSVCDVFFDYYVRDTGDASNPGDLGLNQCILLATDVGAPPDEVNGSGREMQVAVFGSAIYVYIEGEQTIAIRPGSYTTPVAPAGPGETPTLRDTEDMENNNDIIGDLNATFAIANGNAVGNIVMTSSPPEDLQANTNLTVDPEQLITDQYDGDNFLEYPAAQLLSAGDYAFAYYLYDSNTGRRTPLSSIGKARFQDFVFADETSTTTTTTTTAGATGPFSGDPQALDLYGVFEIVADATNYDQVYIFRSVQADSAGGTYAAGILHLENIINIQPGDAGYDVEIVIETGGVTYRRILYYVSKDDRELVYQPTFSDTVLFDFETPRGGAAIFFDGSVVVSKIRELRRSSGNDNKYVPDNAASIRSAGQIRWSSATESSVEMFQATDYYVPKTASDPAKRFHRVGPNVIGLGENRQYLVTKNGVFLSIEEIHEGYGAISSFASDVVGSLLYFVNRKGVYTTNAYGQIEQVNSLNDPIFTGWRNNERRSGNTLDNLYSYGHPVSIAFDSDLSALFIHNEARQEAYVMWFTTSKVTMLEDLPFTMCRKGVIPVTIDPDTFIIRPDEVDPSAGPFSSSTTRTPWTSSTELNSLPRERALFLWNNFKSTVSGDNQVGRFPGLFIVNDQRDLSYPTNTNMDNYVGTENVRSTMLNGPADAVVTTAATYTNATNLLQVSGASHWHAGQWARVVSSTDSSYVGKRFRVMNGSDGTTLYDYDGETITNPATSGRLQLDSSGVAALDGLPINSVLVVGHIPFEVQTWPVGQSDAQGQVFGAHHDFYQTRQIDTVGCLFTDVTGWANAINVTIPRSNFKVDDHFGGNGLVYRGDEPTPFQTGTFKAPDGTTNSPVRNYNTPISASFGQSITDGGNHGSHAGPITPGYLCYLVDTDFRLLNIAATGRITGTTSTQLLVDTV